MKINKLLTHHHKQVTRDDINKAIKIIVKAKNLHEHHMDGSVGTSVKSQTELMKLLNDALRALGHDN